MKDIELICVQSNSLGNWFTIERAHHNNTRGFAQTAYGGFAVTNSARISDADVEGTAEEMLAIADAIDQNRAYSSTRCSVDPVTDGFEFESPRNSSMAGQTSTACAKRLAQNIREVVNKYLGIVSPAPEKTTTANKDKKLSDYTEEELVAALEAKKIARERSPIPDDQIDFSKLIAHAKAMAADIEAGGFGGADCTTVSNQLLIEAVYGPSVWNWWNKDWC